jgi:uncharacterized membrane protein
MAAVATGVSSSMRFPRWMVATLVGSLALNLVVIGAIVSSLWRESQEAAEAPAGRVSRTIVGYASTLPKERREELKGLAVEQWREAEALRRRLQEARTESVKTFAVEPFDQQRFLSAQSALLEADMKSREATTKLNNVIGLHLTAEERRGFLRWRQQQQPLQNPLDVPDKQGNPAQ